MINRILKRKITLAGRETEYTLTLKRIKNINLRIHPDGAVCVSAPYGTDLSLVEDLLRHNAVRIVHASEQAKAINEKIQTEKELRTGGTARMFGGDIPLSVVSGKGSVRFEAGKIIISLPDADDNALKQKLFSEWEKELCVAVTEKYIAEAAEKFSRLGVTRPQIKYRAMKTRHGSCNFKKRRITFNTNLVKYPLAAIELVVYHEFCHLLQPNHGKGFYDLLSEFLPDYAERAKLLKIS